MAVQVASLFGVLSLRDDQFRTGMRNAQQDMQGFGQRLRNVGPQISRFGSQITLAMAPVAALGAVGLKTASDFDASMRMIQARTGSTAEEMDLIRTAALDMGAATIFSGQQASEAMLDLLTSGQTTTQALETLPHVLNLAAASGNDLGQTADVLTDIMAAFGLEVQDAAYVADSLARASASSSADVASLGQGFANVGGAARQFGLSVDETAAILAIFSENGIKGAEAGTQLRSMLTNMARDTDPVNAAWDALGTSMFDATGAMRPLGDVMADIQTGLAGMTEEQRIKTMQDLAGSFGQLGLTALTAGMSIEEMQALMGQQASAASIADEMMKGFGVSVDSLVGSIQTLAVEALTPFMNDVLTPLINEKLIPVVNKVSEWARENPELTKTIIGVAGSILIGGAALTILGQAIGLVTGGFLKLLAFGISPVGLALILAGGLVLAYTRNWGGFRDFINDRVRPILLELIRWIDTVNNGIDTFIMNLTQMGMPGSSVSGGERATRNVQAIVANGPEQWRRNLSIGRELSLPNNPLTHPANALFTFNSQGETRSPFNLGYGQGAGVWQSIESVTINANSYEEGQAAADGFDDRMQDIWRRRGS